MDLGSIAGGNRTHRLERLNQRRRSPAANAISCRVIARPNLCRRGSAAVALLQASTATNRSLPAGIADGTHSRLGLRRVSGPNRTAQEHVATRRLFRPSTLGWRPVREKHVCPQDCHCSEAHCDHGDERDGPRLDSRYWRRGR